METEKLRNTFQSEWKGSSGAHALQPAERTAATPRTILRLADKFIGKVLKRSKFHQYLFLIFIHTTR